MVSQYSYGSPYNRLDAEEHARDCLTDLGPVPDVLGDSQRPTSDTASIRLAKPSDKDAIFDLSKRVHDYDGKRYTDSEMNSLIIRCVCRNAIWTMPKDKSFALVAEADGKIVGFQLVMYPISESQNPGFDLGYSDADAELVLVIDAVVVHPDYRGQKLQSRMISMAEEIGIKRGKHIFIARVDIHNEYSLSNFIAEDYRRCRTYRDMRGVERELLVKRLRDTYKKESQHSN